MMIKLLMIQPENHEINHFRCPQFNNFSQITIPYLAAFVDERYYALTLVDEYCQSIPYRKDFDLVAITVNTPNAPHCYEISARFRQKGAKVVMGGPHVTLLPEEAKKHCDYLIVGEGEITWPEFLKDFRDGVPKAVVFGFDSDTKDVFEDTLAACETLGIDGVTVSVLTPFPKTPVYEQFIKEGRLLGQDWSRYNGKTAVAFLPKNMGPDELFDGYMRFRRKFFSLASFIRRMKVSKTNIPVNFIMNFGYWLGARRSCCEAEKARNEKYF